MRQSERAIALVRAHQVTSDAVRSLIGIEGDCPEPQAWLEESRRRMRDIEQFLSLTLRATLDSEGPG